MSSSNIGEILVANGASFLLLSILLICRHMTRQNRQAIDRVFSVIVFIGLAGTILEPFTFLIDGNGGAFLRIINILANSLEYACTATVSVVWLWYVDLYLNRDVKRFRTKFLPMMIIWVILILMLIGNMFGGYLFTVDADNVYARQPLGYIFYVYLLGSIFTSIILYYRFRAVHGKTKFFPIWMFLTPIFIAIAVQILMYGISVTFLSCSIGLVGLYLNLLSKQSLVDTLTGLYNRAYIEHAVIVAKQSKRYVYGGIMLDIDRFKSINDTFGHSMGDKALIDAANILVNATDRDTFVFRFAGDEFIVMVRTAVGRAEELEKKIQDIEKRIRLESERVNNERITPYRIEFSMGHALFDPEQGEDVFFHCMDSEMYKNKQQHKALQR